MAKELFISVRESVRFIEREATSIDICYLGGLFLYAVCITRADQTGKSTYVFCLVSESIIENRVRADERKKEKEKEREESTGEEEEGGGQKREGRLARDVERCLTGTCCW